MAHDHVPNQPESNSAKAIAPPLPLYLGTLLIGLTLQWAVPLIFTPSAYPILGLGLIAAGIAGLRWAFVTMRRAETTASPYKAASRLTIDGPFRYSRNPIYVAMTVVYLGIALLAHSLWLWLLLVPLLLVMQFGVIRREERYLAARFGTDYTAYCAAVRRWL